MGPGQTCLKVTAEPTVNTSLLVTVLPRPGPAARGRGQRMDSGVPDPEYHPPPLPAGGWGVFRPSQPPFSYLYKGIKMSFSCPLFSEDFKRRICVMG